MYKTSIFIFTRDLRLYDNTALIEALKLSEQVLPIFILNPTQLKNTNKYKSNNCIQFMCECLEDLNLQLKKHKSKLFLFYGEPEKIIKNLIQQNNYKIDAIFMTKDYTPFARLREQAISELCVKYNKDFVCLEDYMLTGEEKVRNLSGNPYVKFTPFLRSAKKIKIKDPVSNNHKNYISNRIKFDNEFKDDLETLYIKNNDLWVNGGRTNGLKILNKINKIEKYDVTRDYPSMSTTNLSAYLKFNVLSIREVYNKILKEFGSKSKLLIQLYWRDFYMTIIRYYEVLNANMNKHKIKWNGKKNDFELWKKGETGFPIVDAGMRQLNKTGYMHNRVRMIVASFLVKILHIDWKEGERYFATKLVDYDPSNNNGGWQWVAGTGTDSQPYFRYLNPWTQSVKYDKDATYIKTYVEELESVAPKDIHNWYESYVKYDKYDKIGGYPQPIYDNVTERVKKAIKMYK